jgi:hypothetical protein
MKIRYSILSMLLVLAAAGCDQAPTGPDAGLAPSAPAEARKTRQELAFPVSGVIEGGTFAGTAKITELALNAAGQLEATGVLNGTATVAGVATAVTGQTFTTLAVITQGASGAVVTLASSNNTPGACDVLFLDLGPLFLDVLGLTVDLAPVVLDLNAVPGAGNLVGNLLCVVVHLLDGPGIVLQVIENILDIINGLLG